MDIEAYSYTVMASILGMSIVFFFLGFLCVLMVVLKKVLDRPAKGEAAPAGAAPAPAATESTAAKTDDNTWIIAAVAAYLEEESAPVSAMAWIPSASEQTGQWVAAPRVQKRI